MLDGAGWEFECGDPFTQGQSDELRPVMDRTYAGALVASSHRPGFPTAGRVEPSLDPDGKGLADKLEGT